MMTDPGNPLSAALEHDLPPASEERATQLGSVEELLGYSFQRIELLDLALTHSSHGNRPGKGADYEGLEFLGDSILGFVVSEFLFLKFPGRSEGELSKIKGYLVSRNQLYRLSAAMGLGQYIRLGRGEEKTGGRRKKAILADVFESVAAAIYLDGGMEATRRFVLAKFEGPMANVFRGETDFKDSKSRLQERLHAKGSSVPSYRVVQETGPEHRKEFLVELWIGDQMAAVGRGRSKKEAEQTAAAEALRRLSTPEEAT